MKFRALVAQQWTKYERLSDREQILVLCTVFVVSMASFGYLIWDPVHYVRDKAREGFIAELELQRELKALQRPSASSEGSNVASANQSLLAIVNTTTAKRGISLKRVEPRNDQSLRVWVDDVSFNQLLFWLELLQSNHNVKVESVSLDQTQRPGSVNSALLLTR